MAPSKRKSTMQVAASSKRAKLEEWADIEKELKRANLPVEVQDMCVKVLPATLGVFADHRHSFQAQMTTALQDILKELEIRRAHDVSNLQLDLDVVNKRKPERDEAVNEAHRQQEAKAKEVQEKKEALAKVALAYRSAREEKHSADEAKTKDGIEFATAEKKITEYRSMVEDFEFLQSATPEGPEASVKGSRLLAAMQKNNFEESLLIALPAVFAKPPDARGKFDNIALEGLGTALRKRISDQESTINAAAPKMEELATSIALAQETLKGATASQLEAANIFEEASAGLRACVETVASAQKTVRDDKTITARASRSLNSAEAELEIFREGPLANFCALQQRMEPVVHESISEQPPMEALVEDPRLD